MLQFETGKTYFMRSPCDHNCIWKYRIISRTAKTVTLRAMTASHGHSCLDNTKASIRRNIKVWDDCEQVMPLGSYSMAPHLTAEHKEVTQ